MTNVEKLSENRVKLTINVTSEVFDKALDMALEEQIKKVKVDGFRPGKMPKSMFISRFGWESLYEDGINSALQLTYYDALQEADVYPTSNPKIDLVDFSQVKKGQGFDYTAEVDVWPEVHLGEYKGLKVKKESTRVLKKDVDEEIEKVLKNKTDNVIKEDAAALGDTVVLDFEGFIDGVPFEGGKGENHPLELGSNSFIPGFEDQLVGVKAGDEKDVNVTFPKNYNEALAGKDATFKCKIHEVKIKVVPTLTNEFVEELEIEGVKTVEEYEEHLKKEIKERKAKEAERKFEDDCMNQVFDASYAEFPESLISQAVEKNVKGIEDQANQYKMPIDTLLGYYGFSNLDDFKKKSEENTRKQYLQELVLDKIIKNENIEASKEEIEAKYLEMAKDQDKVDAMKKQYPEHQIAYQIKVEKAVKLVCDNVAK